MAALLLAPAVARADLFSPGPLARPHAGLEGLGNCTKCHEAGSGLSQARCLACHGEIQVRMNAGRGYHGRIPAGRRDCQTCHHDHRGARFSLVDWGRGGPNAFDHGTTGWPLEGGHTKVHCKDCHDPRLVTDAAVRKLLGKRPVTYLGAPRECRSCHFDEHRGQLAGACSTCHGTKGFKPAPGFDHARTEFVLKGKHRTVACAKCHPSKRDQLASAFPAPRSETFLQYADVPHGSCETCHRDPHEGRFGDGCRSCHVEDGWRIMGGLARQRAFHEKTRYPLRGAHTAVACKSCHGPLPGKPARFRGLSFRTCDACHADAHLGQLAAGTRCETCHDVNGFSPARFDREAHARTQYALEGAHEAVPCSSCHPQFTPLRGKITPAVQRRGRKLLVSLARFDFPDTRDCRTCHPDPHRGQLDERVAAGGCTGCHQLSSFSDLKFDHAVDASFPLEGKHARTSCASCHRTEGKRGARVVRYRPLSAACGSCHADVHVAQLADADGVTDCARCHGTEAFAPATGHRHAPPFTTFELTGKHAGVACEKCHASVEVAKGVTAVRYRPLPTACEGCHTDFHKGTMRRFAQ